MKKLLVIFFIIGQISFCSAQEFYVRVPDRFEFLDEENEYQLNALAAFLLEKHGFEVLYKKETPPGVDPCQVLTAAIDNKSNLFRSKVQLKLQDCTQNTVFTSEEGKSKEKDYKKGFHEAFREAFQSLKNFDLGQLTVSDVNATKIDRRVVPAVTSVEEKDEVEDIVPETSEEKTNDKLFRNGNQLYELKSNSAGFALFKEGEDEKFATLLKSGSGTNYIYSSKNLQGNAFFEASGNLVVEYLDANSGQLISVKYELQD